MSRQYFFILILIIVFVTAIILGIIQKLPEYGRVFLGGKEIKVEVADSAPKRNKGLSGREKLEKNEGMLFVFNKPDRYGIWMKDMEFPIDIIWINDDKIVDITSNVLHEDQKTIYYPDSEVNFILEVNDSFVEENEIEIGDMVLTYLEI